MKKLLVILSAAALIGSASAFANETTDAAKPQTLPCPIEKSIRIEKPECGKLPPKMHKMKKMHRFNVEKFENELGLTNKQKEQAKAIREKNMEAAKPIFEQIRTKNKEIVELKKQLKELRIQGQKDFEAILTKKQLKKLEEIKQERKQKFEARKELHRGGKRPPVKCGCKGKTAPVQEVK